MTVPASDGGAQPLGDERPWATLDVAEKRARVLAVAGDLFAREGLDAPMPALAEALGVGVGSIYRQIGRKEDIVAALLVDKIASVAERFEAAIAEPDAWTALARAIYAIVDDAARDLVTREAWTLALAHPDVVAARPRAATALDALVERARTQGALRPDATADDVRLALQTLGEAEALRPGAGHRLTQLVLRGMSADPEHTPAP